MKAFKSFDEIMDFAINAEIESYNFYKMLADFVERPEMAEMLSGLALQELGHKTQLEAMKIAGITIDEEEVGDLGITDRVDSVEPDAKMDYVDLLIIGMKKEEAARRLYTALAIAAQTREIRDVFVLLARQEAEHKMRFELEYDLATF
ncbi:MAG: ferritin family protein [Sedimentisphaerales bacterium]|nr:ferritin family protein [Sedimentisphaerales bacterium]